MPVSTSFSDLDTFGIASTDPSTAPPPPHRCHGGGWSFCRPVAIASPLICIDVGWMGRRGGVSVGSGSESVLYPVLPRHCDVVSGH